MARARKDPTLLRRARVVSGDYGEWMVAPEHDGAEIWIVAEPPRWARFRTTRGQVCSGLIYRRLDGMVARAECLELLTDYTVMSGPGPDLLQ